MSTVTFVKSNDGNTWQTEYDLLDNYIVDARHLVENFENQLAAVDAHIAGAKDLLELQPDAEELSRDAQHDRHSASENLRKFNEKREHVLERLNIQRARLQRYEEQKAAFPVAELQRERRLNELRFQNSRTQTAAY